MKTIRVILIALSIVTFTSYTYATDYKLLSPSQFPPHPLNQNVKPLNDVKIIIMPYLDASSLLKEDAERTKGISSRFAIARPVDITTKTNGEWENNAKFASEDKDNKVIWRLRIRSIGAASLNLGFSSYHMPEGGELFLYRPDYSVIVGPFTDKDNEEHGQLWTPIVEGDEIVIEVSVPVSAFHQLELVLSFVNHGYKKFGKIENNKSLACNVDVICPEGDNWRNEIRSVGVYSFGGTSQCTGSLINNTADDLTPYFLTAFHCEDGTSETWNNGAPPTVVVYWNYENSTCRAPDSQASGDPGDGSLTQFQTGSILRASWITSDVVLLELDDPVNSEHNVFLNGWDRTGNNATNAVGIHHPNCDEKRISVENAPTTVTTYYGTAVPGNGTHIRVADWDLGTTEGGSSGSPLYNQDRRVIGQLHGGNATCGNNESDWYGRLFTSWTGGGANNNRLSDWLDPTDSGVTILNGMDMNQYNFIDSTYNWIDATTGTNTGITGDDVFSDIPIGFNFIFYGNSYSTARVSSNGYIAFGTNPIGTDYTNDPIPSNNNPNNFIAPFWDDLDPRNGGRVYYLLWGNAPYRKLTIEWHDIEHYSYSNNYGTITFEITLYEGSNKILFQYMDADFENSTSYDYGASATIGLENINGNTGSQYSYNSASISNGRSILFAPTTSSTSPICSGDVVLLNNTTFASGNTYNCVATESITLGTNVTIKNGATVTFQAPRINLNPRVTIESGAVVNMRP